MCHALTKALGHGSCSATETYYVATLTGCTAAAAGRLNSVSLLLADPPAGFAMTTSLMVAIPTLVMAVIVAAGAVMWCRRGRGAGHRSSSTEAPLLPGAGRGTYEDGVQ